MTQEELSNLLGVSRNTVTSWETGARVPSQQAQILLTEKLGVNDRWLRDGKGPQAVSKSVSDTLRDFFESVILEPDGSFRKAVLQMLSEMSDDEWKSLESKAGFLLSCMKNK